MKLLIAILLTFGTFLTLAMVAPSTKAAFVGPFEICNTNPPPEPTPTVCLDAQKDQDKAGSNSLLGPDGIITKIISVINIIIGVAAVIMIMIGGFKYITSSGDANNLQSAKNTILWAVIGLVTAALAQIIVVFVVSKIGTG